MKIFLIGYMGCGKTSVGKKLAPALGYNFFDLDEAFEQHNQTTITNFFIQYGEAKFRIEEQKLLHSLKEKDHLVIGTGGGTPCYQDNMKWMKNNGLTIYLKMDIKSLLLRLNNSKHDRPLLLNKTEKEIEQFVYNSLQQRIMYYEQADIIIKGENLKIAALKEIIDPFIKAKK